MSGFKTIQESEFGNLEEIFEIFFNGTKLKSNKIKICKITKNEAKKGGDKIIEIGKKEINIKMPPKTKNNDIIVIKDVFEEEFYIKIHIFGDKTKRKGRIIYE